MMAKSRRKRRKKRRPPKSHEGPGLERILRQLDVLQEQGKLQEALALIEGAPPHLKRRAELQLRLGTMQAALGDLHQAQRALEESERQAPENPLTAYFLTGVFYQQEWLGHTARTARRALRRQDLLSPALREQLQDALAQTEESIAERAAELGVSAETLEEATVHNERGMHLSRDERFEEALVACRKAKRLIPTWPPPRNNEALYLFLCGEVAEAIRTAREVLSTAPGNLHALANLVRFHVANGDVEEAAACGRRLRELAPADASDLIKVAESLGILGDDEGLYALYQGNEELVEELDSVTLVNLGSAAANLGHRGVAFRLWRRADQVGLFPTMTDHLADALRRKASGPGLAPRYPTVMLPTLVSRRKLEEFGELMASTEGQPDEQKLRDRVERFVAANPHLVQVAAKLMWEEAEPQLGLEMLAFIGTPAAVAEIKHLAFGKVGPSALRLQALTALNKIGALDPDELVEIWDEEAQEWRTTRLVQWSVTSEIEPPDFGPRVMKLIDQGSQALAEGKLDLAREKLEAAVALEPRAAIAHHNLAVVLQRQGDLLSALEHLHEALEVDPEYVFGRCTLARHYLDLDELEAAREVLLPVTEKTALTPGEMLYYQRTMVDLALAGQDYRSARAHLEIILELDPDDEEAKNLLQRIDVYDSPFWRERRARERRRQEKKRNRPTRADATLQECLERLTKEALIGTARAMPVPRKYNVRKALLIQDLVEFLSEPFWLERVVDSLLEEESQALWEVLDAGSVVPWETFATRWDDDLNESPYWQWVEPQTIMGRLRMLGLLSQGTVNGDLVVLVPHELRPLLKTLLE
jgi:tetratricopeptide (TPR) repeat protein